MKFLVGGEEITVREGEVLQIPSWVEHQAEALEDTFELDVFSPIRQDWIDKTDDYFHNGPGDEREFPPRPGLARTSRRHASAARRRRVSISAFNSAPTRIAKPDR